jgi:dTDP-glucose 4,6-dehydratase
LTLVVTGGAGFIGSNLVHRALQLTQDQIVVVDKLTYAGSLLSLDSVLPDPRVTFVRADIADADAMSALFAKYRPSGVLNLAAETHVDRSIDSPKPFVDTNIVGAFVLLETARSFHESLTGKERDAFRFLQVSTDEVYGTLGAVGRFTETTPYEPNSPYAASKASADHLVRAYARTYGLPALVTSCSNNYGPFQFPEKLLPLTILNALDGRQLPIYGDGGQIRDWLHVEDHCSALLLVLRKGRPGEKYNIGGANERTNLEMVTRICDALETLVPARTNPALRVSSYHDLKMFVPDRPAHDRRYAIDATKIQQELGWNPAHSLNEGLASTVRWYCEHRDWCEQIQAGRYDRERLGLGTTST